jgi:thiamine-phosphate pyrophosphorylase
LLAEPRPILCYVTDRHAFEGAPISGDSRLPGRNRSAQDPRFLRDAIRNAVAAGVDWIQIREKDLATRSLVALVRFAVAEAGVRGASVFVNDRLDVALAIGATGVHLGEKSLPAEEVAAWRRSARRAEFRIGVSCHSLESARAAELGGADYIFFGPVFETPSKVAFGWPQGTERLKEICASVKIPVLAIGGVNLENAGTCIAAGAAGIAAIRLFQGFSDARKIVARLKVNRV